VPSIPIGGGVTLHIYDDEAALARAAASLIADRLRASPRIVLGLPTGRTPIAVYAQLIADSAAGGLDWSQVRTFNLDEFVGLPPDHEASYRSYMCRQLFDHVNIDPRHVELPDGMATDLIEECRRYDAAIQAAGGIDLQVLGLGANGHVGFNEPAASLDAHTHRVTLHPQTRDANAGWFGGDAARVPAEALSMGMASIVRAREVLLLATGVEKAEAVAGMIEGPISTWLPASLLQLHPRATAMVDRAAASKLTRTGAAPSGTADRRATP
jgi:glucosamine-6-phosphate deaminase